ncbi:hypothetical protein HII17_00885 [Thalassotalea sp. M1531]|uniref:Uncharacterized protein n=1 Tax=Thalassotalea algicola TaxID=2716224 RepID=A0A7Y0L9S2_9GAMM|nr:hypothetical protein [Thalassotalea algicola]NMP30102.1 hypothetical protein [Thalassotalea algicola]
MLVTLHQVAGKLFRFRQLIGIAGGVALISFVVLLMLNQPQSYLFLSALVMIWCLLLTLLIHSFVQIPPPLSAKASLFSRIRFKLYKIVMNLLLVFFILASLATLFMTFRLLSFGFYR